MRTRTLVVDSQSPDARVIADAAAVLRQGGLVAFPTETVYGLGANALDAKAVLRVFDAKGRPADNPLIVHLARAEDLDGVARGVPEAARLLARAFWPGPLTLVLPRAAGVPNAVTAGLDTVAVRVPAHEVARALITAAGTPVAAPSANRSGSPSPTRAAHVLSDLAERVDVVLDAGPTSLGVESTVLDVTGRDPVVLRPGGVTPREIAAALGRAVAVSGSEGREVLARSPGTRYKHYAPRAPLVLVEGSAAAARHAIETERAMHEAAGRRVVVLATMESGLFGPHVIGLGSRADVAGIAHDLYARLREADARGVDVILAEGVVADGLGLAVMDRLRRAATRVLRAGEYGGRVV